MENNCGDFILDKNVIVNLQTISYKYNSRRCLYKGGTKNLIIAS